MNTGALSGCYPKNLITNKTAAIRDDAKPTRARARQVSSDGRMNKTEARYASYLEGCREIREITAWAFEPIKLRLADRTWYTPDFMVIGRAGSIEFIEVKGFWRDDARVKIKVAAEQFPWFRFIAVQAKSKKAGGGWKVEEF